MKRVYRKLKSDSGASLVFALLVFLLCALTGTVALTAAASNAGRYTHLEAEQREYFSVASALELLQGQLDKRDSVTVKVKCESTETWQYIYDSGVYTLEKTGSNERYHLMLANPLKPTYYQYLLMKNCLPTEWWNQIESDLRSSWPDYFTGFEEEYTIKPPEEFKDTIYNVAATAKNGDAANYALEMRLSTEDGAYPIKAVWTGDVSTETVTTTETTGNPGTDVGTRTTTTTITCTLKWPEENRTVTFE